MAAPPTSKQDHGTSGPAKPEYDGAARRARFPTTVSKLTERLTRQAVGKRGFAGLEIIARWPEIVGADLAVFACPMQVKYPKGRNAGATLLLRVSSSAAATMLHLKTPTILDRVNRFFGYEAVARLEASHGPLPPRGPKIPQATPLPPVSEALAAETARVASDDVRIALQKLGARLQHRALSGVDTRAEYTPRGSRNHADHNRDKDR